jgi:hypothetical protein
VPHHPSFWTGENYFWPSYVSWKTVLVYLQSSHFPDFPNYGPPSPTPSGPGVVVDEHTIYWEWSVSWTILCNRIRITLSDHFPKDILGSTFHAEVFLSSTLIDECWWFEFAGVNEWNSAPFIAYKVDHPDTLQVWGGAQLQQATYAQGGSPWP